MKIIRFFFLIIGLFFIYSSPVLAGACDTTISSATTSQLSCADNDSLTVTSDGSIAYNNQNAVNVLQEDRVTITVQASGSDKGTIKTTVTDSSAGDTAIQGQSSLNLTVDNSGTIWAGEDYGIKLLEAEKVTVWAVAAQATVVVRE